MSINELIVRLESATEGSRELDGEIFLATNSGENGMMDEKIVDAVRTEISRMRAAEVGGCFRPDTVPQGECADGDCYCFRQCDREARAAMAVYTAALSEAGMTIVPQTEN
jgi:hypothetical protein